MPLNQDPIGLLVSIAVFALLCIYGLISGWLGR